MAIIKQMSNEFIGLMVAICAGSITMVAVVISLFLWARSESRADWRRSDEEAKALRKEALDRMADIEKKNAVINERYVNWLVKQEKGS